MSRFGMRRCGSTTRSLSPRKCCEKTLERGDGHHCSGGRQGPRKCCEKAKVKGVRGARGEGGHIIQ